MYLKDLAASLLRRWYLFLVALILGAMACLAVVRMVGPTYEQAAGIVLMPPKNPADPTANRYLELSSLSQAVDVLVRSLGNDATRAEVARSAEGGDYTTAPDATTSAPIVVITATAKTPAAVTATLGAVMQRVPLNLSDLQAGLDISGANRITSVVVSQDTKPTTVRKAMMRAGAATTVLVLVLLTVLIGALDGFLLRRRREPGPQELDRLSARRKEMVGHLRSPESSEDDSDEEEDPPDRLVLHGRAR